MAYVLPRRRIILIMRRHFAIAGMRFAYGLMMSADCPASALLFVSFHQILTLLTNLDFFVLFLKIFFNLKKYQKNIFK